MSLVYETLKPVIKDVAKGMLLRGMQDPDAFMVQLREMQKKGLPLDQLHKSVDFIEEEQYYKVLSHNCRGHHMILYFFGGGFCKPMTSRDFKYAQDMADHTGSDVWIVKYALFPDASGYDIAESAVNAYRLALKEYSPEEISFYGNSSGAALCFETLLFIRKYQLGIPMPHRICAHSPSMRVPPNKEEQKYMDLHDQNDVIIPAEYLCFYHERPDLFRYGDYTEFGSPIEGDWTGFPKTLVVYGSDEVFTGFLPAVQYKAKQDNVVLSTFVSPGCHCFSSLGFLPESRAGKRVIYEFLSE